MTNERKKLVVGFIAYSEGTAKYLSYFMPSLKNQTYKDFKIICHDNSEHADNPNVNFLKQNYPQVEILRGEGNLGFAKAYNRLIARAFEDQAEYFLAVNPDMILEPEAIARLINTMESDAALGSASPLVLRWNFAKQEKTGLIDTCGIKMLKGLRFIDLGQNQPNTGQFDRTEILGPSGAAALYRVSALVKARQDGQYFDELMFMYKEDCDLALRLKLAGFKSVFAPEAVIYHDRTAAASGESDLKVALNRRNKSRQVKRWSFLNQQIMFVKYWRLQDWRNKLVIIWFQIKMLVFALLFERYLLLELLELRRIKIKIKRY
jgi:hypothetical protein